MFKDLPNDTDSDSNYFFFFIWRDFFCIFPQDLHTVENMFLNI